MPGRGLQRIMIPAGIRSGRRGQVMERFAFEVPGPERKADAIAYIREFDAFGSDINVAGGLHRHLDNYEGWLKKLE